MQLTTKDGASRTNTIAFALLVLAVLTALVAFALGRNDPSVRTAVLLCVTNLVTALASIAATLLVGKAAGPMHELETKEPTRLAMSEWQNGTETQTTTSVQPLDAPGAEATRDDMKDNQKGTGR